VQKRFSHAKSLISDEKGNILLITSFVILGLFLMAVGLVEMGRFLIVREQVQTINDAAVLAGATSKDSAQKWVTIDVHIQHGSYQECDTDEDGNTYCWCVSCGKTILPDIPGLESDLLDSGGWRRYAFYNCGSCSTPYDEWYTFKNRELIYDMRDVISQVNRLSVATSNARDSVTQAVDRMLGSLQSREHRGYTQVYTSVLGGISLEKKKELIDDVNKFLRKYVTEVCGFSKEGNLCSYEYKRYMDAMYHNTLPTDYQNIEALERRYFECVQAVKTGQKAYSSLQSVRDIIDDSLASIIHLEEQVEDYKRTAQNTVNSPDYRSGTEKAKAATTSFLKAATEVKGLNYGLAVGESDSTPRLSPSEIYVHDDANSRYYPSVSMILTAQIPAIFQSLTNWPSLSLFNNQERGLTQRVCSQASTFFYDPSGHGQYSAKQGKLRGSLNADEVVQSEYTRYIRVPDDYCKEWRKSNYSSL